MIMCMKRPLELGVLSQLWGSGVGWVGCDSDLGVARSSIDSCSALE